ncbi:MAG: hypothetical protein IJZ35_04570 [Clostridia bacterium]|nr:hypothetical protein [Clostridia bacterium]
MLKGVNRQVVEVADTGSEYFERALFFVNPKYYGLTDGKLRERAQTLVTSAGAPPKSKQKDSRGKLKTAIVVVASALAGSLLTVICSAVI